MAEKAASNKQEPVVTPNHTEKIKFQVLAKTGMPLWLDRVEVSHHHGGKYRVNIWGQFEPGKELVVTNTRIRSSYYLTVSEMGEILDSNPPLVTLPLSP